MFRLRTSGGAVAARSRASKVAPSLRKLAASGSDLSFASGVSASSFQLVTAPTIAGLSIASVSGGAASTTTATLTLATGAGYDVDAAATLSVTVLAAAHSGASDVTSGSLPVTPIAPAVVVSRTSLSLDEDPGADAANEGTYTLVLDTRPTGCTNGVGLSVASGNPDVTPEPTALTFTPDDWNAPQTVTVTAEQDDDGADDRATLRHAVTTACAAAGYPETLAIPSVEVAVADDDAPPPAGDVPTEVRAEATATGLLVTWTAAAGATSYKVQWRLAGQEWSSSRQEETTATRIELDGLAAGSYEVRVVAVADGQDGAASAAAAGEVSEPVNAPPRLAEELPDLQLDVGETRTVDLDAAFEDPNGDRLRYSASSDGAAVSVRATSGGLRVRGVRPGEATVTVTATDPEGLGATVGRRPAVPVRRRRGAGGRRNRPDGDPGPAARRTPRRLLAHRPRRGPRDAGRRRQRLPKRRRNDYPGRRDRRARRDRHRRRRRHRAGAGTLRRRPRRTAGRERRPLAHRASDGDDPGRRLRPHAGGARRAGPQLARLPLAKARRPRPHRNAGLECPRHRRPARERPLGPRRPRTPRPLRQRPRSPAGRPVRRPPTPARSLRGEQPGRPVRTGRDAGSHRRRPMAPGPATITARAALGAPFPLAAMLTASPTPAAETALPTAVAVAAGETTRARPSPRPSPMDHP